MAPFSNFERVPADAGMKHTANYEKSGRNRLAAYVNSAVTKLFSSDLNSNGQDFQTPTLSAVYYAAAEKFSTRFWYFRAALYRKV